MFVLAVLYTFEPIVRGSFTDDLGLADAIWKSTRLAVMCTTVLIAAKLLIDAWLLGWVKVLMENYPDLDFSDNGSELAPVDEEVGAAITIYRICSYTTSRSDLSNRRRFCPHR